MALQGTIDSFAVADVLRLLEASNQDGRLVVSGDRGTASVWVDAGFVVDGEVVDALRFRSGSFVFEAGVRSDRTTGHESITDAIERAAEDLDELDRLGERISSPDRVVCVIPTLVEDQVILDPSAWHSLAMLCGQLSVAAFRTRADVDEVEALRRVAHLLDLGLVELADAPTPSGSSDVDELEPVAGSDVVDDWLVSDVGQPERPGFPTNFLDSESATTPADAPAVVAPRVEAAVPDGLDELFGDFDPFAGPSAFGSTPAAVGFGSGHSGAPAPSGFPGELELESQPADADDLARQMAMLSPRAAQAVAVAVGGRDAPLGMDDEPEGREHVLRFLDSVQ